MHLPPAGDLTAHELILEIDYVGDAARAYLDGHLIEDDFYGGRPWEIGLSRFLPEAAEKRLLLKFLPFRQDAPVYLPPEIRPSGETVDVKRITLIALYDYSITLSPVQE